MYNTGATILKTPESVQATQGGRENADIRDSGQGDTQNHIQRGNEKKDDQRPGTTLYPEEEADIHDAYNNDFESFSNNHTNGIEPFPAACGRGGDAVSERVFTGAEQDQ